MIYSFYTIRDNLIGFGSPFASENDPVAVRGFEHAFRTTGSIFATRPSDYDLYCVGTFDTDSGEITPSTPRLVCNCTSFVDKEK